MCGLLWHLCRWGVAFLGTYLVNDMTDSPRLVQLAGTVLYSPLLIGGLVGGVISDRYDRRRTVQVQLLTLIPVTLLVGALVRSDNVEVWMVYVFMFAVGIGWVTDMTSRRALVFDLVGPAHLDRAMALESISLSTGMAIGALVGGSAVGAVGIGGSYFVIAGFMLAASALLATVRRQPRVLPASPISDPASARSSARDLAEGVRLLRANRGVVAILGVTAIANLFLFAYFPIVPVVAKRLDVSAFRVGLLLAGTGLGMLGGSLIFARLAPKRRGLSYVLGVFVAMGFVVPFALGRNYWFVLMSIVASGVGSGFFGSTQSSLVIAATPEHLRGRALGLLSMAIGALPVGMYLLGELAERTGASAALVITVSAGVVALALWVRTHPELLRMTA